MGFEPLKPQPAVFSPDRTVLDGPPPIPYLHMTDMRSRKFRDEHGLSRYDADSRLDEAIKVIEQLGSLRAVLIDINAEHFRGEMSDTKFIGSTGD
jgi:hypothetical protein